MRRTEEVYIAVLADYIDEGQHTPDRGRLPECLHIDVASEYVSTLLLVFYMQYEESP